MARCFVKVCLFIFLITCSCLIRGQDPEVRYFENLINQETARAFTHPLPEDSRSFKPKPGNHKEFGQFDYIIVGAGSAGAVIANRLTEIPENNVLLIEAGGFESDFSDIPRMNVHTLGLEFNWNYKSTPQNTSCLGMHNQECAFPLGRGLGGTSIVDALMYVRGNKLDFDNWRDQGNVGWGYSDVLPYFRKSENCSTDGDTNYHGSNGNLHVEYHQPISTQCQTFIDANIELGRKEVDYNGEAQLGVARIQFSTRNGRRHSTGQAFLKPVQHRPNLYVLTQSLATKVIIHPITKVAEGVLFSRNRQLYLATVKKEVILSAGVVNTPQLLMLSGIGNYNHLHSLNIPVIENLDVGANLNALPTYFTLHFVTNYNGPVKSLQQNVEEYLNGFGHLTVPGYVEGVGFFQTEMETTPGYPDIQLILLPSNNTNRIYQKTFHYTSETYNAIWDKANTLNSFTLFVVLLHPKSRGTIKLKSTDPYEYPEINTNHLSDSEGEDIQRLYLGIKMALDLVQTNAFKKVDAKLLDTSLPACQHHEYLSEVYWKCQLRQTVFQIFSSSGTCKMGPDSQKGAVVDSKLKVHGIRNLRVADASIAPTSTSGPIGAVAIMIGEKAADLIKNDENYSEKTEL